MKAKKILSLVTAASLTLALGACSGDASGTVSASKGSAAASDSSSSKSASSDAGDLKEIDVVLDWYPNAIHTFLYFAIDKGYFAEEGLDVNLISPADSVDAVTFVASGKAEIGLTYPIEIVQSVDKDMPIKALASVCAKDIGCMASLASNTAITDDMSSLKGHKVGYSGTASSEAIMRTITRNAGLEDSDYEMINVGFDLVTSLTTGSVDLTTGFFINDEIVTMENEGYDLNVYDFSDYGLPEFYGLVMAVNSDSYAENKEEYEGFLRACQKGFDDMMASEDASLDIIMNEMNSDDNPLDEIQQRESYSILSTRMATPEEPFLSMSTDKWQKIIDWMYESELIENDISADKVIVE